ncbi:hypothetical protein DCC85_07985 [Paenibacillus sp. CAA11]|uniref:Mov34/MPN/PAD-1 family protein n=1 Tax=Paenibacillus sp. CAA11 TaxID=1532905 RepID=UPI000D3407D1|nr:M67 family metallopeptidase [Paenibacillus sp. CAA11]AWB44166.1 hypothetical protein DCC85_07985 [Paenibacillus sp. CAA11]
MILLGSSILNEMRDYALEQMPKEACGLLYGRRSSNRWMVEQFQQVNNIAAIPEHTFELDPAVWIPASFSPRLIGIMHSHPTTVPIPSTIDKKQLQQFGGCFPLYFILSCMNNDNSLPLDLRAYTIIRDSNLTYDFHPAQFQLV